MSVSELYDAIYKNNTDLALSLLKNPKVKKNINKKISVYGTCLHRSTWRGNSQVTQALLDAGAKTEVRDVDHWRPIHCAASKGHFDCMKALINSNCDLNVQTNYDETPLHFTCDHGYRSCTEMLLQGKCRLDVTDITGFTTLHTAARNGKLETVKLLVVNGADVTIQVCQRETTNEEHLNKTPYELARDNGHVTVAEYLEDVMRNANINDYPSSGKFNICMNFCVRSP